LRYSLLIFFKFLLLSASYASDGTGDDSYKIPFENDNGLMLIAAQLNSQSGYFIFDSGVDALLINNPNKDNNGTEFMTLSGNVTASQTTVSKLSIGSYNLDNIAVFAADLSDLQKIVNGKLLGVIGLSLFDSEILHIDNINKVIELSSRESIAPICGSSFFKIPITIESDLLMVPLNINEKEYKFVLDTGSSVSMIDKAILSQNKKCFSKLENQVAIRTAHDEVLYSKIVQVDKAKMSKITINDLQFGVSDFSHLLSQMSEGFAGIISIEQLPVAELIIDLHNQELHFKF